MKKKSNIPKSCFILHKEINKSQYQGKFFSKEKKKNTKPEKKDNSVIVNIVYIHYVCIHMGLLLLLLSN